MMREKIEEIGLHQQPQLASSRHIDVNEEIHIVPPHCNGTKRALLVGINYVGEKNALTGCHKDARNMKDFLIDICGFERENMLILMDDDKHHFPTKKLIEDSLLKLAEISEPGDCISFLFSGMSNSRVNAIVHGQFVPMFSPFSVCRNLNKGHGGQIEDLDGDEDDGFDEILIPGDFHENGHIVDGCLLYTSPSPRD